MNVCLSGAARGRLLLSVSLLLCSCAAPQFLDKADEEMRAANYEQALALYEQGLRSSPNDANLKAATLRARNESVARLVATTQTLRSSGRLDDAEIIAKRAIALDPSSERARGALADIERDRRTTVSVTAATNLLNQGQSGEALGKVEQALRENPRHPELIALQRRLNYEQRRDAEQSVRLVEVRPISLQFRDANLKMVLEAFSRTTEINFVLDRDIRPDLRVTVFLRNARLEDALDVLLNTNQLAKKVLDPSTVLIYQNTPEKQKEYQDLVVRAFLSVECGCKANGGDVALNVEAA